MGHLKEAVLIAIPVVGPHRRHDQDFHLLGYHAGLLEEEDPTATTTTDTTISLPPYCYEIIFGIPLPHLFA